MHKNRLSFKKIAVVKPCALGDFIFAVPALNALRETFTQAHISYLGKQWHQEFLSQRTSPIDEVIVIPPVAGVGMPVSYTPNQEELETFYNAMQEKQFDVVIQLYGGGRYSNQFVSHFNAPLIIGTKTKEARDLTLTIPYRYYQSEYMRWLEVVSLIGATTSHIMPKIEVTAQDIKEAKNALGKMNKPIIILHPGSTDLKRQWPVERFAAVGDYFAQKGYQIFVTGTSQEQKLTTNVVAQMHFPAENYCDRVSLSGLIGLLSLSTLLISNDTGPLHLADAIGCKTVGLYWCGNLINAAPPFRKKSVCLSSWMIYCPLCKKDCATGYPFEDTHGCSHEVSFVTNIQVNEVCEKADELLLQK